MDNNLNTPNLEPEVLVKTSNSLFYIIIILLLLAISIYLYYLYVNYQSKSMYFQNIINTLNDPNNVGVGST
jgi:hypothetical protein